MSSNIYQQKIYLVVQGTSCNDILSSIKEPFPKLDELGVREMFLVRDNSENKRILGIDNPSNIFPKILTSFEVPAIESAYILFYTVSDNVEISPVPYISSKTFLRNEKSFDKLKEMFQGGNYRKYWNKRNLAQNVTTDSLGVNSLKSKVPQISWKYSKEKVAFKSAEGRNYNVNLGSSLNSSSFSNFKSKILFPTIMENVAGQVFSTEQVELSDNSRGISLKPIVMVCNFDTVRNFMNDVKGKHYSSSRDTIERGSVWEIEIKYEIERGSRKNEFKFINHSKKFPTELNQEGLTFNKTNESFTFKYKNKTIPMSSGDDHISKKVAVLLDCKFCKKEVEMKEALKAIYNEMENKNKNKNKKNSNNNGNNGRVKNVNNKLVKTNISSFKSAVSALTNSD